MKKLIILLLGLFAFQSVNAQIFNRYKRLTNRAERKAIDQIKQGNDFTLDPIETVPKNRTSKTFMASAASQTNWGKDYLLPDALRQRLVNECTYKVTVKIADTGMPDHAALKQGQLPGKNYTTDASLNDGNGHGTHVAGIIASDQLGICDALVDKGLLRHKSIKVLTDAGSGNFQWVQNAIAAERSEDQASLNNGEFVVYNGSFGGGSSLIDGVETELKKSTDLGVVFCFAAGNSGVAGVNYPGNGKSSIAVASLDQSLVRSYYSTTGPEVWSAMPGRDINSTFKGQTYAVLSGTSMATPFETAVTAIAFSKWGQKLKGLDRVRAYLAWCAKDLGAPGKDNDTGYGIELIQNILDRDPNNTPSVPPVDPPPGPPTPPASDAFSVTPLTVTLANEYHVMWDNVAASANKETATTFKTSGKGSRAKNKGLATKDTKIKLVVQTASTQDAATVSKKLDATVSDFFNGRGFMLPAKQDETWAALWAAYFLEMLLSKDSKWEVDVKEVSLVTSGQTVKIADPILQHWPPGSKQARAK